MYIPDISPYKNSHNIWFAGQSNCGGLGSDVETGVLTPDENTYFPTLGQHIFDPFAAEWQTLQRNKNNGGGPFGFTGFYGSELKLMQLLADHYKADQYMMKYCQGGTSLSIDSGDQYNWSPASTGYYMFKGFVNSYLTAMNSFPVQKIYPKVLIWWQGENDTDPIGSAAYQANFNNFIFQVKNQCALPNLKVIQVGLSNNQFSCDPTGRNTVNGAKIAYAIHGNKFVSTDNAEVQNGGVHFTGAGYKDIAQRIFNVLITML